MRPTGNRSGVSRNHLQDRLHRSMRARADFVPERSPAEIDEELARITPPTPPASSPPPRRRPGARALLTLVNGTLAGVGNVYVGTHSVLITVIAAAVGVVLAVVAMAVKREDRLYSLSGAAPGAAARGARFLTRFGGAGSHFRPRGWM